MLIFSFSARVYKRTIVLSHINHVSIPLFMNWWSYESDRHTCYIGYEPADLTVHRPPRTAEGGFIFFV